MTAFDLVTGFWRWSAGLGWAAVQFTWQAAILGVVLLVVLRLGGGVLTHRDRYRLLGATLAVLVVIPAAAAIEVVSAAQDGRSMPEVFLHAGSVGPLVSALGWIGIALFVWIGFRLVRLGAGYRCSHELRGEAQAASEEVAALFRAALGRFPNAVHAVLGVDGSVVTPQVVGWRRPMIVVPEHMLETLSPFQMESILLHELVHVERMDPWVNLLQSLVEAVVPHPVVGWISAQIRVEREFCCDRRVVDLGATTRDYATALGTLALLESRPVGPAPAATAGPIVARIESLVHGAPRAGTRRAVRVLVMLLMLPGFGFVSRYEPMPIHVMTQTVYPDTPAGSRARQWFQAMESGEPAELRAFFIDISGDDEPYDLEMDVMIYGQVFRDLDGVRPHSVLRSDPFEVVMLGAGGNGKWIRLTLGVEDHRPFTVTKLGVRKSGGPVTEAAGATEVAPEVQREIILAAAKMLRDRYVFEDVGAAYARALEGWAGDFNEPSAADAFASNLSRRLQAIQKDGHLAILDPGRTTRVMMMYGEAPESGGPAEMHGPGDGDDAQPEAGAGHEMELEEGPEPAGDHQPRGQDMSGDGFGRVERLDGGIAYVELRAFLWSREAQARLDELMPSLRDANAIVFDLRGNGGGDGEMVEAVESYLFAEPTHIMNSVRRGEPGEPQIVEESWTSTNEFSDEMATIPVIIIVGPLTGSAAEAFAFGLKHVGRATILGLTSAGAGHRVMFERLPAGFSLALPVGAAISPYTGKGWEGVGVVPDMETPPEASLEEIIDVVREMIR